MLHAKALAIAVACNVYLVECAEGNLDPMWKLNKTADCWTFWDKSALGMQHHSPKSWKCPGYMKMRVATWQHSANRSSASSATTGGNNGNSMERDDNALALQLWDASTTNSFQELVCVVI